MSDVNVCELKNKYEIKVYMGNYDKNEFYSIMGKFFAERLYKNKLPYLVNDTDKIWYLIYEKKVFLGFFGVKICTENTLVSDIYINTNDNKKSIFKYMAEYLVNTYQEENLKVLTRFKEEQNIWNELGFEKSGMRGNYAIMNRSKKS